MKQLDLFETTLEKKIVRIEKWIVRLNKELNFLKAGFELTQVVRKQRTIEIQSKESQMEMFG